MTAQSGQDGHRPKSPNRRERVPPWGRLIYSTPSIIQHRNHILVRRYIGNAPRIRPSERNPRIPIATNSKPNTELHLLDGGHWLLETNLDDVSRHVRAGLRWHQCHAQGAAAHCATHKIRRNRHEIRIFRYISSEKIRLKLSQLKERNHDGHDIRI